ncbi:glycine--tRNA ligase [Candidatus Azambacteria bacterium]|nr:glycine--tRNA ligase [Candidatus Azambacteria bacterium]
MDKVSNLAKRRGFIFPGSELYGGLSGTWDYGPLGVLMKNNVKRLWWGAMVERREEVVGLDAAILMNPKTWEASGHLEHFRDPLVECKSCHQRFRADELLKGKKRRCPHCGGHELTDMKMFNTMFKTFVGPVEDAAATVYLRPETAQGIFVNFENVLQTMRLKIPFGIAQIGKAFRNEITTGNWLFRSREFEQMELEYFVEPKTAPKWHAYWVKERLGWYRRYGISPTHVRERKYKKAELAHYSAATSDVEYRFPWGWDELEGIANRQDYDLTQHARASGKDLAYFDEARKRKYLPFVIEPSAGVDRCVLAFLLDGYREEEVKGEKRVRLALHPALAPIKAAVFPLVKADAKLVKKAREVYALLKPEMIAMYDEVDSVGRRYRRQDEIGTPFCVTIDGQTLADDTVTVRERDTMKQERVSTKALVEYLREKLTE